MGETLRSIYTYAAAPERPPCGVGNILIARLPPNSLGNPLLGKPTHWLSISASDRWHRRFAPSDWLSESRNGMNSFTRRQGPPRATTDTYKREPGFRHNETQARFQISSDNDQTNQNATNTIIVFIFLYYMSRFQS
jgi:hypothetical protein